MVGVDNDEDIDLDFEDWLAMSEREQERELQTALREHDLMLDSMSAHEHFAYQGGGVWRAASNGGT